MLAYSLHIFFESIRRIQSQKLVPFIFHFQGMYSSAIAGKTLEKGESFLISRFASLYVFFDFEKKHQYLGNVKNAIGGK